MKRTIQSGTLAATIWLGALTTGWAQDGVDVLRGGAGNDVLIGGRGNDIAFVYDPQLQLLTVLGDDNDNDIEVGQSVDGSILINDASVEFPGLRLSAENTARVMIDGGAGNDVLIGSGLRAVAICGGKGYDAIVFQDSPTMSWDNTKQKKWDSCIAVGDDLVFQILADGSVDAGGAGLDILIGNTGGDRIIGELGNDWIVGGTGRDGDIIGGWGDDWIVGGTGSDGDIIGGWGNDWISGGTGSDGILGAEDESPIGTKITR